MNDFQEKIIERVRQLEREVERLKVKERPAGGSGVTDHGALTGLADNDHPQYRLVADAIDHGALDGLSDNDHPQYLLTTGKAADSDKLDGVDSTGFVNTTGTQTVGGVKTFSSIPVLPSTNPTTANQAVRKGYADATYLGINAKAADADKLDGIDSTGFATASHDHAGTYLPLTGKAADADKLDGKDSSEFAVAPSTPTSYTATLVGWSGTPNQAMKYVTIGKLMILTIYITGTSNTTTASATLPSGVTAAVLYYAQSAPMRVTNAGSMPGSWGMASVSSGGSVINFYVNQGGGGWTGSGTKAIEGTLVLLIA